MKMNTPPQHKLSGDSVRLCGTVLEAMEVKGGWYMQGDDPRNDTSRWQVVRGMSSEWVGIDDAMMARQQKRGRGLGSKVRQGRPTTTSDRDDG